MYPFSHLSLVLQRWKCVHERNVSSKREISTGEKLVLIYQKRVHLERNIQTCIAMSTEQLPSSSSLGNSRQSSLDLI